MRISILRYLLVWAKERLLNQKYTDTRSRIIDAIDFILEELRHAKI